MPCSLLRDKKDELLIEQELKETSAAHRTQMPPAGFWSIPFVLAWLVWRTEGSRPLILMHSRFCSREPAPCPDCSHAGPGSHYSPCSPSQCWCWWFTGSMGQPALQNNSAYPLVDVLLILLNPTVLLEDPANLERVKSAFNYPVRISVGYSVVTFHPSWSIIVFQTSCFFKITLLSSLSRLQFTLQGGKKSHSVACFSFLLSDRLVPQSSALTAWPLPLSALIWYALRGPKVESSTGDGKRGDR